MNSPSAPMGRRGERLDLLKKFGWTSLASVFQMMTGILSVVVLTRFLTPTDYGLFGLAIIAIAPG
ncbi:MAG: oligosaccharide flippase family protein [Hyphomonas sp.]|nr:oligosaccharide flippase family protein [Hyphomonas sp.]